MNAIPHQSREEGWDEPSGGEVYEGELPRRPRRQLLNRYSALVFAVLVGAIGFLVGVRVEKGHVGGSSAASLTSRFAALGTRGGSAAAGGATTTGKGAKAGASAAGATRGGGFTGFGGGFDGGGTVGTVSSIDGKTLYVSETGGNTVKVTLSSATKITKDESVARAKIAPGDSVTIAGVTGSKGSVSATSVTDSGDSSTSTGAASSSSGGSAISSLFGSGG